MIRAEILDRARLAVTRDRAATHGRPENTFGLIAGLWSARLGLQITPAQVCIMLVDLKTARAWDNPVHMDNWDDMAGYAACGGELAALDGDTAEEEVLGDGTALAAGLGKLNEALAEMPKLFGAPGYVAPKADGTWSWLNSSKELLSEPDAAPDLDWLTDPNFYHPATLERAQTPNDIPAGPPVDIVQDAAANGGDLAPDTAEPLADEGPDAAAEKPRVAAAKPLRVVERKDKNKPPVINPWTDQEESDAIHAYVAEYQKTASVKAAIGAAAAAVNRPFEGVKFRFYTRLKRPLAKAMAAACVPPAVSPQNSGDQGATVAVDSPPPRSVPMPQQVAAAMKALPQAPKVAPAKPQAVTTITPAATPIPQRQRILRDHMTRLGNPDPFTPYVDYSLVSDLDSGIKLPFISADLGIDTKLLQRRWESMIEPVMPDRGHLAPEDQQHLLAVLRARLDAKVQVAK